jgi:hypothetical protein
VSPFLLNLFDRIGWTFFQALGGTVAAGETTFALNTGVLDWRADAVGALTAAVLSALKVFGVHVSKQTVTATESAAEALNHVSAVHNVVTRMENTEVGSIATEVAKDVAAHLSNVSQSKPAVTAVQPAPRADDSAI